MTLQIGVCKSVALGNKNCYQSTQAVKLENCSEHLGNAEAERKNLLLLCITETDSL